MNAWGKILTAAVVAAGAWYVWTNKNTLFSAESQADTKCVGCQDFIEDITIHDYGSLQKPEPAGMYAGQAVGQTISQYGDPASSSVHAFGQNYSGRAMGL